MQRPLGLPAHLCACPSHPLAYQVLRCGSIPTRGSMLAGCRVWGIAHFAVGSATLPVQRYTSGLYRAARKVSCE